MTIEDSVYIFVPRGSKSKQYIFDVYMCLESIY